MQGEPNAALPSILLSDSAPIWLRDYSQGIPLAGKCEHLSRVLTRLSAERLIVGHTVQTDGITRACGGKVWRIDVGLSRYYGGKVSVLEIRGDNLRIIQETAAPPEATSRSRAPHHSVAPPP
jgi:hypothetical protein